MSMNVTNSYTNATAYDSYAVDKNAVEAMKAKMEEARGNQKSQTAYSKGAEVTLSSEGMKSYHDNILKTEQGKLNNQGITLTDFNTMLGSKLPSSYGEKNANGEYERIFHSATDQANSLLSAYAEMYDEIQKGYEAGTRETYVEDKTSETGYRKLTKEEEIAELDKAFQFQVGKFERRNNKDVIAGLAANSKKVSELSSGRAKITGAASEELEKRKSELDKLPENIGEKLIETTKLFAEQYNKQAPGIFDFEGFLKNFGIKE